MNFDRRLLRAARPHIAWLLLAVGLGAGAGAVTVWQASLLSQIVARVFLGRASLSAVSGMLALLLAAAGLRQALAWGGEAAGGALARRVKDDLRRRLARRLLDLGPLALRGEQTGELSSLALEGIEALEAYFGQYLPGVALAAFIPLTILAFVFPLDPLSGVVLLVTAPLIPLFMVLIGGWANSLTQRQWTTLSRMSAYFLDVLQGLTTLKLLGRSQAQADEIARVSERFRRVTLSVLRVSFLSALSLEMLATISTAVVAVEVGLRLLYGRIEFQPALFILVLAPEFYQPLRALGARFHAGMAGVEAARRLFAVLNPEMAAAKAGLQSGPVSAPAISFTGVSFTYSDGTPGLADVSLELPAGKTTALVGPSGSGKSTLAALLLGFARPGGGRILVDGQDLSQIDPANWRAGLAWVPQIPYLFPGSVAENLRLARPQASKADLEQAARLAEADDFIRALPQGYDTPLGERGARLSAGQIQRLTLARAFLRDAPLLILDEPTAHLDPASEAAVQAAIERLLAGRTALVIAHRRPTLRRADQIIALEGGRVASPRPLAPSPRRGEGEGGGGGVEWLCHSTPPLPRSAPLPSTGEAAAADLLDSVWGDVGRLRRPTSPQTKPLPLPPKGGGGRGERGAALRLLSLLRPFAGLALFSLLAGAATVLSGVGLMAASAYILSAAARHPSVAVIQTAIVGVRFFGLSRGIFRYLERYLSHDATLRLLTGLRVRFYQALEPLAPARLAGRRSGDLLARILGDIAALENFYVRAVAPPGSALIAALGAGWFLGRYAPGLAWAWLGLFAAVGVGLPLAAGWLGRRPGRQTAHQRAALSMAWVEGLQGMPDLIVYGQGGRWLEQIERVGGGLSAAQERLANLAALQTALVGGAGHLALWLALVIAVPLVSAGRLDGVYLASLALAALTGFEAAAPLPLAGQFWGRSLQAAARLFEIVDAPPAVAAPSHPLLLPAGFDLEVRGLSFAYPAQDGRPAPAALRDLSFRLPAGKRLAIVGPSGVGKSTLVWLLLRFWDYSEGEIRLGGVDLRRLEPEALRQQMAVLAQPVYLFSASVRDNLRLAYPPAAPAQIEQAARLAGLHARIQSLPQGYDTWIGEQVLRLSGGERQRLALARALLRPAPLLILDEPTAHLDPAAERQVMQTILEQTEGRSLLLITHSRVGLEAMDEIVDLGLQIDDG